ASGLDILLTRKPSTGRSVRRSSIDGRILSTPKTANRGTIRIHVGTHHPVLPGRLSANTLLSERASRDVLPSAKLTRTLDTAGSARAIRAYRRTSSFVRLGRSVRMLILSNGASRQCCRYKNCK